MTNQEAREKLYNRLAAVVLDNSPECAKTIADWATEIFAGVQQEPDQIAGLKQIIARQDAEIEELRKVLHQVDMTLRISATEYVPAIGDVFKIIDAAKGAGR